MSVNITLPSAAHGYKWEVTTDDGKITVTCENVTPVGEVAKEPAPPALLYRTCISC